jgi:O-antigen/teichoic acid export membrane protein
VTIRSATADCSDLAIAERETDASLPRIGHAAALKEDLSAQRPALKRLSLRANFGWTLAGNVCNAACTWLIVVIIVKLGSMELAGFYAFAQALVLPVVSFSTLQLRGIYATDATNQYRFGHYLGLRVLTTGLALAVISALALESSSQRDIQLLTLAIGLGAAIDAISDIIYGALQQRERMHWIAASMIVRSLLGLAAVLAGLLLTNSLIWSMLLSAGVKGLVVLVVDVPLGVQTLAVNSARVVKQSRIREVWSQACEWNVLRTLAWLSLPLAPTTMLMTLQVTIPRYLIEHWLDAKQLGLFAAQSYLTSAGAIVATALAQAAAPRMAQHFRDGDARGFRLLLVKLVALGGACGAVGVAVAVLFGKPLLSVLYAPEYAERNDLFIWLMVGAGLTYVSIFLGWGMTAARRLRIQLPLFALIVAVMLAAGCLLVPRYGLSGAAATVVVGSFVQVAGSLFVVSRAARESVPPLVYGLASEEAGQ